MPAVASAQVSRCAPQLRLELSCRLRFAKHPDDLQQRLRHDSQFDRDARLDLRNHGLDELASGPDVAGRPAICRLGDWLFRRSGPPAVHHNPGKRERPPRADTGGYQSNTDGARLWPRNLRDPPISQASRAKPRSRSAIQYHLDRQLAGGGHAHGGRHRPRCITSARGRCWRAR